MYLALDKDFFVVGMCPVETPDCTVFVEEVPENVFKCQYKDGVFLPIPKCYCELRAEEYPPLQDQLDMQYWDKVNGTNIWAETISAIKQKYSKEAYPQVRENCC
jgi:hypothetical protein